MDLRDPNAHRFFTIVIALGTAGWIVNAVVDSSALTWSVAAIWLLLIVVIIRRPAGRPARQKRRPPYS